MACNIYTISGLNAACKESSFGGIKEIYAIPYNKLKGVVIDSANFLIPIVEDAVDNIYQYKLPKNTGSITTTQNVSETTAPTFQTEVTIFLNKLDTAKRLEVMGLMFGTFALLVKDSNNKIWFLGNDDYVECTAGTAGTGTASSDASQYSITFRDISMELPYEVKQSTLDELLQPWEERYLTFEPLNEGVSTIGFYMNPDSNIMNLEIEYSFDKETWDRFESDDDYAPIFVSVEKGQKLYCRGINSGGISDDSDFYNYFSQNDNHKWKVYGNLYSIIDYRTMDNVQNACPFIGLFGEIENEYSILKIIDAKNLVLPAKTLTIECYRCMFQNNTSLQIAPKVLPATTLKENCYVSMFEGCESLIATPELPATVLKDGCYNSMFKGCTSLTTAPELPASTLQYESYYEMFYGCTKLNYIKCLALDIQANGCTSYWLYGVYSTGTFVKDSTMSNWTSGVSGIPSGWTIKNA